MADKTIPMLVQELQDVQTKLIIYNNDCGYRKIHYRNKFRDMPWNKSYIRLKDQISIGHKWVIKKLTFPNLRHLSGNFIRIIMHDHGIWYEDQNVILQVFSNDFCMRFKKDSNVVPS